MSKLIDLEIDEVSVVDRGANQHSLIAFSKSLADAEAFDVEESMSTPTIVYTEDGEAVSVDDLDISNHGQEFFVEDGSSVTFFSNDVDPDSDDDNDTDSDDDGDDVEAAKAFAVNALGEAGKLGASASRFTGAPKSGKVFQFTSGLKNKSRVEGSSRAYAAGAHVGRNSGKYALGGAAAIGGGAAGAAYASKKEDSMSKSLSEDILAEFSKAVTDRDREQVVAKMADEVQKAHEVAAEALAWAEAEHDARMNEAFISKAAEYNLPVAPEVFGPILKSIAVALDEDQLEILDEIFNAVGDALYNEIGYVGESSNSSVLDQVDAMAEEFVGKADVSKSAVMTAMFEANPAAYDAYISEMGR